MQNLKLISTNGVKHFIKKLKKISPIEETEKYSIMIDYGNGKSIQVIGQFKASIKARYRRLKRGKRYKYFKTEFLNICELEFIGNKII